MGSHVVGSSDQATGKSLKFKVYSERTQGRSYAAAVDRNCNKDSYDLSIKREIVDKNANWLSNNMVGINGKGSSFLFQVSVMLRVSEASRLLAWEG